MKTCFDCNNLEDRVVWLCGGEEVEPEKIDAEMCEDSDIEEEL